MRRRWEVSKKRPVWDANVGGVRQGGNSRPVSSATVECGPGSQLEIKVREGGELREGLTLHARSSSLLLRNSSGTGVVSRGSIPKSATANPIQPPPSILLQPTAQCLLTARRPTAPSSPSLHRDTNLPIFSWGRYHERYSFRQDLQAMCTQVA
jgi:hypothetical protein